MRKKYAECFALRDGAAPFQYELDVAQGRFWLALYCFNGCGKRGAQPRQIKQIAGRELGVVAAFGGARVYVGKRAGEGAATRNAAIRRDYRAGERRYGLGRVQIWRIINDVPNR